MKLTRLVNLFAPFGGHAAGTAGLIHGPRDEDITAWVAATLDASGRFAIVTRDRPLGTPPQDLSPSCDVGRPDAWEAEDPNID
jgi:hypothetical protein